jgi:hypothetical protein
MSVELPDRIAAEQARQLAMQARELEHLRELTRHLERERLEELASELRRTMFVNCSRPGVSKKAAALSLGFVSRRVPRGAVRLSSRTNEDIRPLVECINKLLKCTEFRDFEFTSM